MRLNALYDLLLGRRPSTSLMDMSVPRKQPLNLQVTLWPSFPHFTRFVKDKRLAGIRMNSAMIKVADLTTEIADANATPGIPLWFDVKGRQLRVAEAIIDPDHLELILNHKIDCPTPIPVWFKAGEDVAKCIEIRDGNHLIFEGGPAYMVEAGESIHIRHPALKVFGPIFVEAELEKIERVRAEGFNKWYLSYVETWAEIDEFRSLIGKHDEVRLKIESKAGLQFVANQFHKRDNLSLVTACGDLYIEIDWPHQILNAAKLVVEKDPEACVGSRMLLSLVGTKCKKCSDYQPQDCPSLADLAQLAWFYDIGYRDFLLCDELCLKEALMAKAVNVFDAFRKEYCHD